MAKKQKDETQESKGGGKSKVMLIVILGLLVVGAGAFGGVYFYLQSNNNAEVKVVTTNYVLFNDVTLNLSDENGKSYLKTSLTIEYDQENADLAAELEKKKINIQDSAIWYLKSKCSNDFSASNEIALKEGLVQAINSQLEKGQILDVFLVGEEGTGFVVQKV
ncbi:flagellar basal body-associated FliL family protein [uncultured Clostridium sp.]|uniref:flagellar basal body-associated FliL family protein n=1 Tax=uncultured Clostridium sp. TaxID=59620 RepID=UPI0025ECF3E0|nr:flagellar basal body-associated FliL family protein [uncultured Clostridium sp.]